jgi:Bacterial Ig-like domain (group 2)
MRSHLRPILLVLLLSAALAAGCGGERVAQPLELNSVTVAPANPKLYVGETQQFTATGNYSDASAQDLTDKVKWSTSNSQVMTIDSEGLGSVIAAGTVTVTATSGTVSGSTPPITAVAKLESISLSPPEGSVSVGGSQQFSATGSFSDGSQSDVSNSVSWSVDGLPGGNTSVGTVSSGGLYESSAGPGAHQISVTSAADSSIKAQAAVSVLYAGMLTYHNDLGRTGQILTETTLSPANVNSAQFGKLFSYPVDGAVYAQPLYVQSVTIPGQGVHNVVYVATEHDSVYAFDADGKGSSPLWHVSFINPSAGITSVSASLVSDDAFPAGEIGITSTPVIDPGTGTLFVVPYTDEEGQFYYRLHALDITTGAEKLGGPVVIQAVVPGTGAGANGQGQISLDQRMELQRPGLALVNGVVYVGFGSHADTWPWHGWLLAYDGATLQQEAAFNSTPNSAEGAIWAAGGAPAVDASGNVFVVTGNGTFDATAGGIDYGDTVLKLDPTGLNILDWFTPFNQSGLDAGDVDLGSGGVMLLPDQAGPHPHLLAVAGKEGRIYLLDRDNLGGYGAGADSGAVQELIGQINSNNLSTPGFWQGHLYYASEFDTLKMFTLQNGTISGSAVSASKTTFGYAGATPSISANGSSSGVVWVVNTSALTANGPAQLFAYDATDVSHELYDSSQAGSRDTLGPAVKFTVPTVWSGKVYVGTATELDVLGVLKQ